MNGLNIALVTSTIAPDPNVFLLARSNPSERLEDYKKAFAFYCDELKRSTFDRIIYADNSGYPLNDLAHIAAAKQVNHLIEFISFKSNVSPQNSRFYLEINLIDHVVNNSQVLRNYPNWILWKITGRYLIENIASIVATCRSSGYADVYVNFRDYPRPILDFYLIGLSLRAYRQIFTGKIGSYEGITDGELLLRKFMNESNGENIIVRRRLPVTPRVLGFRGYDGGKYGGAKDSAKYIARVFANRFLPWLWI